MSKLLTIEKECKSEAGYMCKSFISPEIKNRVYVDVLGAELLKNYLTEECEINAQNLSSMHSITRVVERINIADIILPNIYIDARMVFNEDEIFIPKSHFENNIQPDIYVVFKAGDSFEDAEFLGYFEPELIDKNNENDLYYFIEKDKLSSPDSLVNFIKSYNSGRQRKLTDEEFSRGRELAIELSDHTISDDDFKELLSLLIVSEKLREAIIEYDNFETLSYSVASVVLSKETPKEKPAKDFNYDESSLEVEQIPASEDGTHNSDLGLDLTDGLNLAAEVAAAGLGVAATETAAGAISGAVVSEEAMKLAGFAGNIAKEAVEGIVENKAEEQYVNIEKIDIDNSEPFKSMPEDDEQYLGLSMDGVEMPEEIVVPDFSVNVEDLKPVETNEFTPVKHDDEIVGFNDIPAPETATDETFEDVSAFGDILNDEETELVSDLPEEDEESIQDLSMDADVPVLEEELQGEDLLSDDIILDEDLPTDLPTEEELATDLPTELSDEGIELFSDDMEELNIDELPSEDLLSADTVLEDLPTDLPTEEEEPAQDLSEVPAFEEEPQDEVSAGEEPQSEEDLSIELAQQDDEDVQDLSAEFSVDEEVLPVEDEVSPDENSEFDTDIFDEGQEDIAVDDSPEQGTEIFDDILDENDANIEDVVSAFDLTEEVQEENMNENGTQESDLFEGFEAFEEYTDDGTNEELDENLTELESFEDNSDMDNPPAENVEEISLGEDIMAENTDIFAVSAFSNSSVISDKTLKVGEIPIDINYNDKPEYNDAQQLENIYNESNSFQDNSVLKNQTRIAKNGIKKNSPLGLAIGGAVVVIAIIAVIGLSAMKILKPAQEEKAIVSNNTPTQLPEDNINAQNPEALDVNDGKIVGMEDSNSILDNAPKTPAPTAAPAQTQTKQPAAPVYLEVSKLSWEVPDYISTNAEYKQYFQSAGKSLKASLSSDLLLAQENVYSDQVRVSILYDKTGIFKDAKILLSSGSAQVDKIVLQSLNHTLKLLKAPASLKNDESTTVILKIYL